MPKVMPEDLLNTVIAADDLRRKARGQPSTRAALLLGQRQVPRLRLLIEPFFNALGWLWGQAMVWFPSPFRRRLIQWTNRQMSGVASEVLADLSARIAQTVRMAQDIQRRSGQWPALLILTSHPETEGPRQWLRFEVLRQGLLVADALAAARRPGAWYPRHPRCFLAIDPFALDTVSWPVGGFYAGWMHRIYLAWDRQPSTQSWIQKRLFLRGSGYARIAWRVLKCLHDDIPILMVLSGGLPYNARLLYAAREFVQRLETPRWTLTKRQAQKELMQILMTPEGDVWPADAGDLPPGKIRQVRDAMARWGISPERIETALLELRDEFRLDVPYRERLFHVLLGRLVSRGKPVVLLAIRHDERASHVRVAEPLEIPANATPREFSRRFNRLLAANT